MPTFKKIKSKKNIRSRVLQPSQKKIFVRSSGVKKNKNRTKKKLSVINKPLNNKITFKKTVKSGLKKKASGLKIKPLQPRTVKPNTTVSSKVIAKKANRKISNKKSNLNLEKTTRKASKTNLKQIKTYKRSIPDQHQNLFKTISEQFSGCFIIKDIKDRIIFISDSFAGLFDLQTGDFVNQHIVALFDKLEIFCRESKPCLQAQAVLLPSSVMPELPDLQGQCARCCPNHNANSMPPYTQDLS